MKSLCFVALSLTICWPVASPDVSGGGDCEGHVGTYPCAEENGADKCDDITNVFNSGYNSVGVMNRGLEETELSCEEYNDDSNCVGVANIAASGCESKVKPPVVELEESFPL